jgi:hypothetical protein
LRRRPQLRGTFFLKFRSDCRFNAKLYLNGHEYAKRQLAQEGISFEALDNGILSCGRPNEPPKIPPRSGAAKMPAKVKCCSDIR